MDGQAESAPESGGLSDLASFLADTPLEESTDEDLEATSAEDETADSDTSDEATDEQEDDDSEESDEPAPVAKITFKVKGEDGVEETVEASTDELAASYLRQKDYTKKTQALATRENEAVQFLTQKHEEIRSQYLSQAEASRAAIVGMAGIKSESEMDQLSRTDPAAWVAETNRAKQISSYLNQLDQQIQGEKQAANQQAAERQKQALASQYAKTWEELSKVGVDKPKLQKVFESSGKNYGFSAEELANVYDHRLVLALKDAAAYRELQANKGTVTKKAQDAPRMPTRQAQPAQERLDKALDNRFKSGRAKLSDLASFLR